MIEQLLTNERVLSVLVQMPFVTVMGVIMLGMRRDLQDLRQDLKDCVKSQSDLIANLVARVVK